MRNELPDPEEGHSGIVRETGSSEEESLRDISGESRNELLDPAGWQKVLETFAHTMKLAVAMTDPAGRLLGQTYNPQPTWRLARASQPEIEGECPFCLPASSCTAVREALRTGAPVIVQDRAGLAHVTVPLSLNGRQLGTLIAGQVFVRYPEPLSLQRVARDLGISRQQFWQEAVRQVPVPRASLLQYADLLMSFGQAFVGERYAAVLERKLAQTSHRYRLFVDGVKEYALHTVDCDGRITSWNSGAERLFGYTESEILGHDSSGLRGPGNIHREVLRQTMVEVDRLGWVTSEGWRVRKDGSRFFAAGVLAAMGDGAAREYGELLHDVTELRRSAEEMQQAQKLEAIGVLAGGIAHDFNNLLTSIILGLGFVKPSFHVDDPMYRMVEIAEQSSVRAAELVAQLLGYAGKGKIIISRFDLSELIAEVLPLISASIPKNCELELLLTKGLPWIEADASQIHQIVMNLIINGAEALGPAGGTVRVLTGVSHSNVFMEVKDSGSGMSEATKAQMFEPFFTTKFTGRGLGLAAVSGIVRNHKGTIHVDSVPNQGTTFTVSFPAVTPDALRQIERRLPVISRGTATILIVDDEPELRKMAAAILERSGYSVCVAKDGREAVELFRQNARGIALVLLDVSMPVMGGCEALQLIRGIRPDVPVIMSSGYSNVVVFEELGTDVVVGFIKKPYSPAKLLEGIQEALQQAS